MICYFKINFSTKILIFYYIVKFHKIDELNCSNEKFIKFNKYQNLNKKIFYFFDSKSTYY